MFQTRNRRKAKMKDLEGLKDYKILKAQLGNLRILKVVTMKIRLKVAPLRIISLAKQLQEVCSLKTLYKEKSRSIYHNHLRGYQTEEPVPK